MRDVSYGAFLWLNLGWDGPPPDEQRRRLKLWCRECGLGDSASLVGEIKQHVQETIRRRRGDGAEDAAQWWQHQLAWLDEYSTHIDLAERPTRAHLS